MIAEGLTASSASVEMKDILFKKDSGQGSVDAPTPPAPPQAVETSDQIVEIGADGSPQVEKWKAQHVTNGDGNYTFQSDVTLRSQFTDCQYKMRNGTKGNIIVDFRGSAAGSTIDMNGKKLTLDMASNDPSAPHSVTGIGVQGNTLKLKTLVA